MTLINGEVSVDDPTNGSDLVELIITRYASQRAAGASSHEALRDTFATTIELTEGDPNYNHVGFVERRDSPQLRLWIKKRADKNVARREKEALEHMAEQNGVCFGPPYFSFPIFCLEDRIVVPDVGPDLELLHHKINEHIVKGGNESRDYSDFRWALVCRQIDMIAKAIAQPYVPQVPYDHDPVSDYKRNLFLTLCDTNQYTESQKGILDRSISLFSTVWDGTLKRRYVDSVLRNMGFRYHRAQIDDFGSDWFEEIFLDRLRHVAESPSDSLFKSDQEFLQKHLFQLDLHLNEKNQLDGESIANIINCPQLLHETREFPFTRKMQETAFTRYWLWLQYWSEVGKGEKHDPNRAHECINTIRMTDQERSGIGLEPLADFGFTPEMHNHYLAMQIYRAIRSLWYCHQRYIPKYEDALQNGPPLQQRIAAYRLPMVQQDITSHFATALRCFNELEGRLYESIAGKENQKCSVYLSSPTPSGVRWYHIKKSVSENGFDYSFFWGRRQHPLRFQRKDYRSLDEALTTVSPELHVTPLAPQEKGFGQLLAIEYMKHLLLSSKKD